MPCDRYHFKPFTGDTFLSLLIYFERRGRAGEGQRERDRDRESQAGSPQSAQSPMWGLNSRNHGNMKSRVRRLTD